VSIYEIELKDIDGNTKTLAEYKDRVILAVNVASKCGLTPQYQGLEQLYKKYSPNLVVLGFPCNQFAGQEPGTNDEIKEFCSTKYNVTFPLFDKLEVNGPGRHKLYEELVKVKDQEGNDGDIAWNFEKFLISRNCTEIIRFRPQTEPFDEKLTANIERLIS
jgi:glutathione peroxidase